MGDIVLQRVTMLSTTAVSTGQWFSVDWRYSPNQTRTVAGTMNASDVMFLEGTLDDPGVAVVTFVTIESTTGATSFSYNLFGPWGGLRIRKTGTAGDMIVKGLI